MRARLAVGLGEPMDRQGYQRAPAPPREDEAPVADGARGQVHDRLDAIAARLDRIAKRTQAHAPVTDVHDRQESQPEDAIDPLDRPPDSLIADREAPDPRRESARPASAPGPSFSLDDAIAEISARQQELDREASEGAAPAVDLSGVEHLLHDISDQIETLRRPCAVEESVEALRRELAEIGRAVAEPKPQPALDAVQAELRVLAERIDRRPAPVEVPALSAIERGLDEVRNALNARAPTLGAPGSTDGAQAFARSGPDAATLDHLDTAIAELRNVSHRVVSGDQLAALASDVRTLGTKIDRVAPSAIPSPDGTDDLIRRMDTLAAALEGHPKPSEAAETGQIETQLRRLSDKLDTAEAAADQRGFKQLEAQFAQLTRKLDATDARLDHLGAIEHAVVDLVEQLQDARIGALDAAQQAARAAVREMVSASPGGSPEVDALKHELAEFRATQADIDRRTQDMLETLQSTLERLVDRLSVIETELPATMAAEPAAAPAMTATSAPPAPPPLRAAPTIERRHPHNRHRAASCDNACRRRQTAAARSSTGTAHCGTRRQPGGRIRACPALHRRARRSAKPSGGGALV